MRDKPDPHVHIAPGFSPAELDEHELWQIAVLLERHHLEKPEIPIAPDDWEKRVEMYEKVREARARKAEALSKKKRG